MPCQERQHPSPNYNNCSNIMSKKMGGSEINNKSLTSSPAVAPGGPPIQVTRSTDGDRKTDEFSEKLSITCNMGNRSFSLELTQEGIMDRVFAVKMEIEEKVEGKASAKLIIVVALLPHQANSVFCMMSDEFNGAIKMQKEKLSYPHIPDTEIVKYNFTDYPKSESCFYMQKKSNAEFVERIGAAHCFSISEDAGYHVAIKIAASNRGLCVEVEGPMKRTKDFMGQHLSKFSGKMQRKIAHDFVNGIFGGSADKDMNILQALGSYVNTGMQSQKGLINSSGFMKGIGNGGFFNNCRIFSRK